MRNIHVVEITKTYQPVQRNPCLLHCVPFKMMNINQREHATNKISSSPLFNEVSTASTSIFLKGIDKDTPFPVAKIPSTLVRPTAPPPGAQEPLFSYKHHNAPDRPAFPASQSNCCVKASAGRNESSPKSPFLLPALAELSRGGGSANGPHQRSQWSPLHISPSQQHQQPLSTMPGPEPVPVPAVNHHKRLRCQPEQASSHPATATTAGTAATAGGASVSVVGALAGDVVEVANNLEELQEPPFKQIRRPRATYHANFSSPPSSSAAATSTGSVTVPVPVSSTVSRSSATTRVTRCGDGSSCSTTSLVSRLAPACPSPFGGRVSKVSVAPQLLQQFRPITSTSSDTGTSSGSITNTNTSSGPSSSGTSTNSSPSSGKQSHQQQHQEGVEVEIEEEMGWFSYGVRAQDRAGELLTLTAPASTAFAIRSNSTSASSLSNSSACRIDFSTSMCSSLGSCCDDLCIFKLDL